MDISIIIVNYKSEKLVRYCVEAIQKAALMFPYEIIIVNNDIEKALESINPYLTGTTIIQSKRNVGMGAGNNLGIRAAKGEYIIILNPDAVVLPGSIETLVEFANLHPKAGIVAPRIVNPDKTIQSSVCKFPSPLMPFYRRTLFGKTRRGQKYLLEYMPESGAFSEPSTVEWVFGPAFLIRKDLATRLNGYDEHFFLFFEDTDLCRRVWKAGYEVWYLPKSQIVHYPDRLSGHELGLMSLFRKTTWIHIHSWIKYFWKWRKELFK